MKAAIRQRARELGFDDCRFTTAAPPKTSPQFLEWIKQGRHGLMGWLERGARKRAQPQNVLAGAQSIVTLATSYHQPDWDSAANSTPPNTGVIARYARHEDYHDVLEEPLKQLTQFIGELAEGDARSLWYVDTGPLLERDFAQRSGVGFAGKHTNLISRRLGNWTFLSEIITTLPLEPDEPEVNRCGKCVSCIDACPTDAITAPFQLDSRLCISYLTIELKGSIPETLRPAIGARIYGCDDCLAACPWNRFAQEGRLMKQAARADMAQPDLLELLALDAPGFKRRFAGTPMLRTKRRGILRNVCVALGNTAGPEALPALERATQDEQPLIAEHAQWAIAQIENRTKTRA